jgi:hypothetical protein
MYTVWHVDKYKITFKLVIDHWPRAQYQAAARRLRNTGLEETRRADYKRLQNNIFPRKKCVTGMKHVGLRDL